MKTKIVAIGNSQGVRIPKALLEQTGLKGEVHIDAKGDWLIIRPAKKAREGWREAFQKAVKEGDVPSANFDEEEWEWPDTDSTSTSSPSTRPSEAKSKKRVRASSSRRTT